MKFSLRRSKNQDAQTTLQQRHFIELCYRHVLKREADEGGLESYLQRFSSGEIDHAGLMEELIRSEEYRQIDEPYNFRTDPVLHDSITRFDDSLIQRLQRCSALTEEQYNTLWTQIFNAKRELIIGQQEYGRQHKQRFWELCNAVVELTENKHAPRALEFGISEFSGLYKTLCPELVLDCADRPTADDYIGFNANTSLRVSGGNQFVSADLNKPRTLLSDDYQALHGQYNLVLFTEVLEHLTANPVDILEQLLALLQTDGYLYLTTPNFFRKENVEKFSIRANPQEAYPAGEDNWDAHHHHREYGLKELLSFIDEAGGTTSAFYFSDCWDEGEPALESERGNMVFVVQKQT